ncbi:39S ribosomal protein L41, mitochondrial isoform X1 [Vombatus ursinus]|uniref:39S ribosomal protein L41, mitochondrial isoform X1 n=1 Tax=Vombatus ursinus TaxID=29139 RepID=UPI000FFD955C|nr:39S ribosomal protein L41, mitochondrial isoform X1 [Vombatus ursinus]
MLQTLSGHFPGSAGGREGETGGEWKGKEHFKRNTENVLLLLRTVYRVWHTPGLADLHMQVPNHFWASSPRGAWPKDDVSGHSAWAPTHRPARQLPSTRLSRSRSGSGAGISLPPTTSALSAGPRPLGQPRPRIGGGACDQSERVLFRRPRCWRLERERPRYKYGPPFSSDSRLGPRGRQNEQMDKQAWPPNLLQRSRSQVYWLFFRWEICEGEGNGP